MTMPTLESHSSFENCIDRILILNELLIQIISRAA